MVLVTNLHDDNLVGREQGPRDPPTRGEWLIQDLQDHLGLESVSPVDRGPRAGCSRW